MKLAETQSKADIPLANDPDLTLGPRHVRCPRCRRVWYRRGGKAWWCPGCDWPDNNVDKAEDVTTIPLLTWIDQELELRNGHGSYARGQRYLLRHLQALVRDRKIRL